MRDRTLLDLLTEHGLELLPEHDFPNDGWSGATFTSLLDEYGRRFVLKRTSLARDWIARSTRDDDLREAWLASRPSGALSWIPRAVVPYLGAAADGDGVAILVPDLSTELIAWERPGHDPAIDGDTLTRVIQAVARLHSTPWSRMLEATAERDEEPAPPWCPLAERLTLLTPVSAARLRRGGQRGGRSLPRRLGRLRSTGAAGCPGSRRPAETDVTPLVAALAGLPSLGLHGDLKLANIALLPDDRVGFIDWQMMLRAPLAVEMGWFLVSNSGSLPLEPEEAMAGYRERSTGTAAGGPTATSRMTSPVWPATGTRSSGSAGSSGCCSAAGARASTPTPA